MVYSVITIANKFIDLAKNENLTNMQLQKMVYIAHGFNLALRGTKLYYEDTRAWNFGPVVPELYEKLQIYGSNKVTDKISISNVGKRNLMTIVRKLLTPYMIIIRNIMVYNCQISLIKPIPLGVNLGKTINMV
ncbi:hypothetical protein BSPWISOXPB_8934 [uncultured Gammaproteobacteria bacterium]|nr:hypothetical protein BSPWISOXPB_8934 [uncultured Gammaproteobacteria bacterium]